MTPEEYQRIKEAEKEHLRKLKKLKEAMRLLESRRSVNQALENMAGGSKEVFDEHASMVEKLALETARQEARLEIALEGAQLEDEDAAAAGQAEQLEEDLLQARARALLQRMKRQMGSSADDASSTPSEERPAPPKRPEAAENPPTSPDPLPEKTIGRMKP